MGDRRSGRELLEQAGEDAAWPFYPHIIPSPISPDANTACLWSMQFPQRQCDFFRQHRYVLHARSTAQQGQRAGDALYRAALNGISPSQLQQLGRFAAPSSPPPDGASCDWALRGPGPRGARPPSAAAFTLAGHKPPDSAAHPPPASPWTTAPADEPRQCPPPDSSAHVWGRGPLAHYWALGYRHADLDALFAGLPDALRAPLHRAAAAAAVCDDARRGALRAADPRLGSSDGAAGEGEQWTGGLLREPGWLWEAEEEAGFLSVSLNPATGRRRGVAMNRRHAELMGAAGREELLALARRDEVGLGMPEADLVACLAHELVNAAEARTELYLRVAGGPEAAARGAGARRGAAGGGLVHCVKVKEFDGLGRVSRVRLIPI
jgi:hypothetical protein